MPTEIIGDLEPRRLVCHEDVAIGPLRGCIVEDAQPDDVLATLVLDGNRLEPQRLQNPRVVSSELA